MTVLLEGSRPLLVEVQALCSSLPEVRAPAARLAPAAAAVLFLLCRGTCCYCCAVPPAAAAAAAMSAVTLFGLDAWALVRLVSPNHPPGPVSAAQTLPWLFPPSVLATLWLNTLAGVTRRALP